MELSFLTECLMCTLFYFSRVQRLHACLHKINKYFYILFETLRKLKKKMLTFIDFYWNKHEKRHKVQHLAHK